jgi:glutathione S-transferase
VGGVPLALLDRRCDWLAGTLAEHPFRMGERYTVADPYLFTILDWTSVLAADLGHWPALKLPWRGTDCKCGRVNRENLFVLSAVEAI